MELFDFNNNKLIDIPFVFSSVLGQNTLIFKSFLPKEYWQKRGLFLLLQHPSVTFVRLPDDYTGKELPKAKKDELKDCFNPVLTGNLMSEQKPEFLRFYVLYKYGLKINKNENPFINPDFLLKFIRIELASLNHSQSKDIAARYIMPLKTLLMGLKSFPDKIDEALPVITNIQNNFFNSYEVNQLLYLLKEYVKKHNNQTASPYLTFYNILNTCKNIPDSFEVTSIDAFTQLLSDFYNQYKLLRNA